MTCPVKLPAVRLLRSGHQLVVLHPVHILLDDGFQFLLHLALFFHLSFQVVAHQQVVQGIDATRLLTVELQHIAILAILIDAVEIVYGVGFCGGSGHQVAAERQEWLVIAQQTQHGGQDVYLLCNAVVHAHGHLSAGIKDDERCRKTADVGLILRMVAQVGVVAGQHKEGVLVPRLLLGRLEKLADGHVGIAYALVDGQPLFGIHVLVFFRNDIGRVARHGETSRHEGFFHLANLRTPVLQERLIPDAPVPVKVGIAAKSVVGGIVLSAIVRLEAHLVGKSQESHAAPVGTVEECRVVALACQQAGHAGVIVHRGGGEHERFFKHRNATEHGWHAIDALSSVAERVFVGGTLADKLVNVWGVALVSAVFELLVESSDILAAKTFDDQHHHVLLLERMSGLWMVYGREHFGGSLDVGIVGGNVENVLPNGSNQ